MKILSITRLTVVTVVIGLLLGGCGPEKSSDDDPVALANPASEYCVKKGGKLEIIKDAEGDKGMCYLPDGTVIEEWELFRRDNAGD